MTPFGTYLLAAMVAWTHLPSDEDQARSVAWERAYHEPVAAAHSRYEEISEQLAAEAESRGGSDEQERAALDLIAIAFEETGFHRLVDDGTCNLTSITGSLKRAIEGIGGCDSGKSFTLWQLHLGTPDDRANVGALAGRRVTGADLLESRELAIKVAWNLRERRPSAWTAWPRAARRSVMWLRAHPLL